MAMNTVNVWDGALKTIVEDTGVGGITYIGEAIPGTATSAAGWRIQRITVAGTTTTIEWVGSGSKFNQIWDNRTSLSYV